MLKTGTIPFQTGAWSPYCNDNCDDAIRNVWRRRNHHNNYLHNERVSIFFLLGVTDDGARFFRKYRRAAVSCETVTQYYLQENKIDDNTEATAMSFGSC